MGQYAGQPTFGKFRSWYVGDDGITRNRWTGETVEEMRTRFSEQLKGFEARGQGNSDGARLLRGSLRIK